MAEELCCGEDFRGDYFYFNKNTIPEKNVIAPIIFLKKVSLILKCALKPK